MLYASIVFFAIAAILGIFLLSYVLRNEETPKTLVFSHGPLAAIGLVLLIVYTINKPGPIASVILFTIAAFGGIIMVVKDLTGKSIPKWLAILHGVLAVAAFVYLLVFTFTRS
jgi:hypothetical protein